MPILIRAVKVNPRSDRSLYSLGTAQLRTSRTAEAIDTFRALIKLDPKSGAAELALGTALYAKGDLQESENHLKQSYKLAGKTLPHVSRATLRQAATIQRGGGWSYSFISRNSQMIPTPLSTK